MRSPLVVIAVVSAIMTGCLPYTVGSTAQTVPAGKTVRTGIVYVIPNAVDLNGDRAGMIRGTDVEIRRGLDDRSDIGLRVPASSGVVVTYKRRLAGTSSPESAALSVMAGGGLVNLVEHAEGELTLLASGREDRAVTAYGGVRAMHVLPLSSTAVRDEPSVGGFLGMRLRFGDLDVSPEVGVYYDRSALGIRSANYIVVPGVSITARGARAR